MGRTIRWGILAPSSISRKFTADLALVPDAEVLAVGSRSLDRAQAYAAQFAIERAYGSYEELVADPDIDVVYISSPHPEHYRHALLALRAGKAALVEKPFAMNSQQAEHMVAVAKENGVFLMEALWSRTHPASIEMTRRIREGQIGDVRVVNAYLAPIGSFPDRRSQQPELGGGALLEIGVYPLSIAYQVLADVGEPEGVSAWGNIDDRGIDQATTAILRYDSGATAVLACSYVMGVSSGHPAHAYVSGTTGWIDVPRQIHWMPEFTIYRAGHDPETVTFEPVGNGYSEEASEVVRCLQSGRLESELVPLEGTLVTMRILDRIRKEIGLVYATDIEAVTR
ncbi:MAG: Gfo/Idh/MocA family oxidoreductase [Propionicimonas sp.]